MNRTGKRFVKRVTTQRLRVKMEASATKEVGAGKASRSKAHRPRPQSIFYACKMQKRNFMQRTVKNRNFH